MNVCINALDNMGSLLWANYNGTPRSFAYAPFGSSSVRSVNDSLLPGFNGERLDPLGQSYHLGNGYRTYRPTLMRFNVPDGWSPFGPGGLNQYTYCQGDPINRADPSGHMSSGTIGGIVGAILGIVGAGFAIWTFGASIAAIGALETLSDLTAGLAVETLASASGLAAAATGIASSATSTANPSLSRKLGFAAQGLGIISFVTGAVDAIHAKVTGRSASFDLSHDGDNQRPWYKLPREPVNNQVWLSDDIIGWDSMENGKSVFNICGHGALDVDDVSGNRRSRMYFNDTAPPQDAFHIWEAFVGEDVDFSKYDHINIFSCYSANGGPQSFAQDIADLTGKAVTGYRAIHPS